MESDPASRVRMPVGVASGQTSPSPIDGAKEWKSQKRARRKSTESGNKEHTEIQPKEYQCKLCARRYSLKKALRKHMLKHVKQSFKCDICGSAFITMKGLVGHKERHTKKGLKEKHTKKGLEEKHTEKGLTFHACAVCKVSFKNKEDLHYHMLNHRGVSYECILCLSIVPNLLSLYSHTDTHFAEGSFKCRICEEFFLNSSLLKEHMVLVHRGRSYYPCEKCTKVFELKAEFLSHVRTHEERQLTIKQESEDHLQRYDDTHGNEGKLTGKLESKVDLQKYVKTQGKEEGVTFKCWKCNKLFSTIIELSCHNYAVHKQKSCLLCRKEFKTQTSFNGHMDMHRNVKRYTCFMCHKMFRYYRNLGVHKRKVHGIIEESEDHLRKYGKTQGKEIPEIHKSRVNLEKPVKTHVKKEGVTYQCSVCTLYFSNKIEMSCHSNAAHKQKTCLECGLEFQNNTRFKGHMDMHRNVKRYTCSICQKMFRYFSNLGVHKKKVHGIIEDNGGNHSKENGGNNGRGKGARFKCKICSEVFKSHGPFKNHMDKHKGITKHKCNQCSCKFGSVSTLKVHQRLHKSPKKLHLTAKERMHPCPICKKFFKTKGTLSVHMKVHGPKTFSCSFCKSKFTYKCNLERHIASYHSSNVDS